MNTLPRATSKYAVGVDFGTESGRTVLVDVSTGRELASSVHSYANGVIDETLPGTTIALGADWALQDPNVPVARAVWRPQPDLKTSATAWILAGGAHHTGFSQALTAEHLEDFAEMAGIEFLLINNDTRLPALKKEIRWNDMYYLLAHGLR
jgi:L-arabinose isomerase